MDELSMSARTIAIGTVIDQLRSLEGHCHSMTTVKDADEIWTRDVTALQAAAAILEAMQEAGVNDAEQVADLLHDYNGIAEQYRAMRTRYEVPRKPFHADGVWHCPRCNKRVGFNNTHCHWCGQKIKWG